MNCDPEQTLWELAALLTESPVDTPRLLLRPFRQTDLEDVWEYRSQKEQQRLSLNSPVDTLEDAQLALDWFLTSSQSRYFAIVLKAEDKVIGNFTLNPPWNGQDPPLQELRGVTLSYILHEGYWRQGLMTELLRAVYPILFETARLDYIQSGYLDFNAASAALHRKLGMRPWRVEEFHLEGQNFRSEEMLLLREEYLS